MSAALFSLIRQQTVHLFQLERDSRVGRGVLLVGLMAMVSSAGSRGVGEIEEAPAAEEEKVYVAVGEEFKTGKTNLSWVLRCTSRDAKIVITHVHRPAQMINMRMPCLPSV